VLQLGKERLRDSARQGLAESYDIGRILGHGISLSTSCQFATIAVM
jgi:hypothetical protein